MEVQEMTVIVQPDGSVKLEVRGVKGPACLALTESIEKALGGEIVSRELSPEHAEAAQIQTTARAPIKSGW